MGNTPNEEESGILSFAGDGPGRYKRRIYKEPSMGGKKKPLKSGVQKTTAEEKGIKREKKTEMKPYQVFEKWKKGSPGAKKNTEGVRVGLV